jgi:hypothetical protein
MDIRRIGDETACVTQPSAFRTACRSVRRTIAPTARMFIVLAAMAALTACERLREAMNPPQVDVAWQGDSTLLAGNPTVLFRVMRTDSSTRLVPIATTGSQGLRPLFMSNRGWRALDVTYMHGGARVVPYRGSNALPPVEMTRGMWEGAQLDTIAGCTVHIPAAIAPVPDGVHLFTSGSNPVPNPAASLAPGELNEVLNVINTLVAPTAGVPLSLMSRYKREVFVGNTGATSKPTIVVSYDDPDPVRDSTKLIAERPRQLIVVLDKSVYGYKPSLTLKDVSANRIAPRRVFLGFLDGDGDGKAELFFGLQATAAPLVTFAYRYQGDAWIEAFNYQRRLPCQF